MAGEQRFVVGARIIGALHRDTPKLKVFMISVSWSDETEVIVHRSFQDFKKFHRLLKRRFPHLNPFRKNSRVIPKFKEGARRSSLKQKGSTRSARQMKELDSYMDRLFRCDVAVTQSTDITQFFTPKDHELRPDYTKNSVMLLLSDEIPNGPVGRGQAGGGGGGDGGVTHPFVTQSYRCVDAYETKDTKNRPFKVAVDEKLDVLIKDPSGWWLVENESKCLAWFPAPFLELWDGEDDDGYEYQLGGSLYCAVRSYNTKKADEVSVPIGSVVEVLRKSDNGWWLIRFNGKAGYIPSMYLQPYNNPRAGLYSLQSQMYSSTLYLDTHRAPNPTSVTEEQSPRLNPAGPSSRTPGRLHKAQSLDVLSDALAQTQRANSPSDGRAHSFTDAGSEFSLSSLSSGRNSSSSLRDEAQDQQPNTSGSGRSSPDRNTSGRRDSSRSSESSGSGRSRDSGGVSVTPKVPTRPKTEEILNRCTTMTRKAALATKTRLQIQPSENIHSR